MPGDSPTSRDGTLPRAVFLSYAREDSPAALRIAEALRLHGVEVWFDQSELRGGDAWDQKIRRQIKECALFVPVISGNTQSRGEGYFRLEWKLAVERTHLMAEGVPFLAPVVVDATPEGEAIVPPEFMRVQWIRLAGSLPTPEFVGQIRRMLESPGKPAAALKPAHAGPVARQGRGLIWAAVAVGVLVVAAAAGLLFLRRPAAAQAVQPAPSAAPAAVDPKSIAVLPFENMSDDKDNAFFAQGVHEDVLTNLSYVRDLHVVSRTSVMKFKETTKSIKEIGQELGVAYVLEGSVRREGNKVRVTGQLIDARTDEHVWAKAYDRDLNDIFAIQGELAQAIAAALQAVLSPETKALIERRPTENTTAYDDYVKARQDDKGGWINLDRSLALLREAVRLDRAFAAAWAEMASRLAFLYFSSERTDETLKAATDAIDSAVRLAPDDPAVIEGRGDYYYYGYRDYGKALEQYVRLAAMRPNDPVMYLSLALIERRQGRVDDAIASVKRAITLDPANHALVGPLYQCLWGPRRYDEAVAILGKAVQDHPDSLDDGYALAVVRFFQDGSTQDIEAFARRSVPASKQATFIYLQADLAYQSGHWKEFIRLRGLQRYYDGNSDDPQWGQDVFLAEAYAEAGDMASARSFAADALARLKAESVRQPTNSVVWSELSLAHALLGNRHEALDCAAKSADLLPEARDALVGPANSINGLLALAWLGENDRAVGEMKRLFSVPWGADIYYCRAHFRTLKDDPRFKALVNDPTNNTPLP